MEVLNSIPFKLDTKEVLKRLRLRKENKDMERMVQELLDIIHPIAKPKAVYKVSYVDNKNGDSLYIDGVNFTSRVLRINLDKVHKDKNVENNVTLAPGDYIIVEESMF